MRPRFGSIVALAVVVGAVPTLVSLCDLRCAESVVATPTAASSESCHGSAKERGSSPTVPDSRHDDCLRHVLLARGDSSGIPIHLDRSLALAAAPVELAGVASLGRPLTEHVQSADLSPPPLRSFDILRL